jgi:EAL domain-containing protein (putative c-di-GMP-specific phosphodiesterase class I)
MKTKPTAGCRACREDVADALSFTMAFQPIVDLETGEIYAHEALVRGLDGGGAASVLSQLTESNRYSFDQACRVKAISLASRLGMQGFLSINFLPNAVYQPAACLRKTMEAAAEYDFPLHRLIFEVTENEQVRDPDHLKGIFQEYKRRGMITAIDDFGAGHSGLNLLAEFQPDIIKLDMELTRDIHLDRVRSAIVKSMVTLCLDLGISIVAEGIERVEEALALRELGVRLFQGYCFARPAMEALPPVDEGNVQAVIDGFEARQRARRTGTRD